ncbi:MAG: 5'/3'-nucleotidase SurE [Proteobacteria bacterium]|nr:5'/3'-nucleotidase SurE [Pseudomonadota bacterium]MDA1057305.1 5'/3'-nucleotidase SurE [Pseudomonadota bacterium]
MTVTPLRILVTNDDGINAPGLKVLEKIARALSDDIWVVAPEHEQSGASHSLTLTDPLRVRHISKRRFAVDGTPTDCVVMAINMIVEGRKPDLLLSGVNRGSNVAEDVTYSGTVAAAMEGTLLGIPSIAMSQVFARPEPIHWSTAEKHGPGVVRKLRKAGWPTDVLINVNFPPVKAHAVTGTVVTVQGRRDVGKIKIHEREDPRGGNYYWLGFRRQQGKTGAATDLGATMRGQISVTPLKMNFTHGATRKALQAIFK